MLTHNITLTPPVFTSGKCITEHKGAVKQLYTKSTKALSEHVWLASNLVHWDHVSVLSNCLDYM